MLYPVSGPEGWRMIGRTQDTADVTGVPALTQRFRHPSRSMVIHGCQIGMILVGDPSFTAVEARIYSDRSGSPGKLLRTSTNSWTKAQCLEAEDHGVKFAGFNFNFFNARVGVWYHLALIPLSYTGDYDSHLGWRTSYPDPQYPTGLTVNAAKGAKLHLDFALIGALVGAET